MINSMKFESVNELEKFSFEDCVITGLEERPERFILNLEALIVLPENSQNTNFTKSYAGDAVLSLVNWQLVSAVREGFRYYDSDGKLLSETPDEPLDQEALKALWARLPGAYLFSVKRQESGAWSFRAEFPPEETYDTLPSESYELVFSFETARVEWDYYMNRVQTPGQ